MPPRVLIGSLVQLLLDAEGGLLAAEQRVADVLTELLPDWRGGWAWGHPLHSDRIDIYDAIDSPAAAAALWLAGFIGGVTIHGHGPKVFRSCPCITRRPT